MQKQQSPLRVCLVILAVACGARGALAQHLTPYAPAGWSDKIVVATSPGTHTDSNPLRPGDTLYVDWAVINDGTVATTVSFYTDLYVDGVLQNSWHTDPPLDPDFFSYVQDYSIGSLPPGTHTLEIKTDTTGTIVENGADRDFIKTITVSGGAGCIPDATALCLNAGRFKVQVSWATPQGTTGMGTALPLTDDTGYFWFFSNSNVELILKILDARAVNNHFWVFYGALSDVAYTITITDSRSGGVKTYSNPQGHLASAADTAAFPGDGSGGSTSASATAHARAVSTSTLVAGISRPSADQGPRHAAAVGTACAGGPTALCLNANRFKIEATWRVPAQGTSGTGTAVTLSGDTGYFWFFGSANVEIVIKVLDGTTVNGNFWVFYGALSNVEYTLHVTDTVTGAVKDYTNQSGTLASVADTTAFGTTSSPTGLLDGATNFAGPYPTPTVTPYSAGATVTAFPGQVQVFFQPFTTQAHAEAAIQANGGAILAKVPVVGYYLVGVAPGNEQSLISSIRQDPRLYLAALHVSGYLASAATLLDGCDAAHSMAVQDVLISEGGTFKQCRNIVQDMTVVPDMLSRLGIISAAADNAGGTTLLNLSAAGGLNGQDYATSSDEDKLASQNQWKLFMRVTLASLASLPDAYRENLAITIAAGNGNMPIDSLIAELRADQRVAGILKNNVLIVTSNQFALANSTGGDPDVGIMTNPLSAGGTSLAAPAAMAYIQNVMLATGASAKVALEAAKLAVASNANHQLQVSEAIDKASAIIQAQQNDPAGSAKLRGISFTSVGETTAAVITPALAGVTVQYTVSGTDGYYDSGSLQTDSSGSVSFGIPAGASGVVDRISVAAVLSGLIASTSHTW